MKKLAIIGLIILLGGATYTVRAQDGLERYPYAQYIHNIHKPFLLRVYGQGQAAGNNPAVFAKVGDSFTMANLQAQPTRRWFLLDIGDGKTVYGAHSYYLPIVTYFSQVEVRAGYNSFNTLSQSAKSGRRSFEELDTLATTQADCLAAYQTPLECEYDTLHPAYSIIMHGSTESANHIPLPVYEASMRAIIEQTLARGIIPILSTLPIKIPHASTLDTQPYNDQLVALAREYKLPYMDLRTLSRSLPDNGIGADLVHFSQPPDKNCADFSATAMAYGCYMRNILSLESLRQLKGIVNR